MTLQPRAFACVAIPLGPEGLAARQRADIVVSGLEQAGPSFELRIFLNDPSADGSTKPTQEQGYAGSIHVYGYGSVPETEEPRSGERARLPMTRQLIATDALRAAAAEGPEMTVTLVPVAFHAPEPEVDLSDVQVSVLVHE